ncbi:conserved phage C-terminal domain-containing protein [Loigolactobacillus binensis]|uniref:Conserved phage C-terminal domain-containing protein n=1 Tax=Loigolactobacillus binensis TaxID=2559922 RepID=A0ABW3E8V4_9LACO|nr:conserved phage C-terminal domain-containing protein [Loigolactobacillus binensis]
MKTLLKIPTNLFELPEFIKLTQLAKNDQQVRTAQLLWLRLACAAGRTGHDGYVTDPTAAPLTKHALAGLVNLTRGAYAAELLQLLLQADLLQRQADGHYQISHWERYALTDCAPNYHGLFKFDTPATANATPPTPLQQYTPEQRTKLVATTGKILAYLQQQSGKQFSNEPPTQQLLANLFAQKVTVKQIKWVIDWKCKDWYGGDFWKFVRPQTLFGPKFTQYLLEAPPEPTARPAAGPTRHQYLRDLFEMSCGDIETILWRAADEKVTVTRAEVEAIGRELGH